MSHVVILGAGATIATIPNGDKNGIKAPAMANFFETTNMGHLLEKFEIKTTSNNLEDIYSELYKNPIYHDKLQALDDAIYNYFFKLELPDNPTIYDLLILGLTENDLIATFNWDPLLMQAYIRCSNITMRLPNISFLHGNVAMGYCPDCLEPGLIGGKCSYCSKPYTKSKLLYPIKTKNYNNDKMIYASWHDTQLYIKNATIVTVFGYSAPTTDSEAINLFKSAWGEIKDRRLEEFEFINLESEELCVKKWKDFVYTHHYRYSNSFYESYIGMFPRRSAIVEILTHNFGIPHRTDLGFKEGMSFEEVTDMLYPLLMEEEDAIAEEKSVTSKFYVK